MKKAATAIAMVLLVIAPMATEAGVGFTAGATSALTVSGGQTMVFDQVETNEGNGYNPTTGVFTAPSDGLYMISYKAVTQSRRTVLFELMAGGNYINSAWARGRRNEFETASNTAVLKLSAGEEVYVRSKSGTTSRVFNAGDRIYTTFSAALLFDETNCPAK